MLWLRKFPIFTLQDESFLEREAARLQFEQGLSKDNAENLAYQQFKLDQHIKAAAYHLACIENCKNTDAKLADRHAILLKLHLDLLNLKPEDPKITGNMPSEVNPRKLQIPADSWALDGNL